MATWQILLLIHILSFSVSSLLQKVALKSKDVNPIAFSIGFQLLVGVFIGIVALFKGISIPNLWPIIPNLILMVSFYSAGNIFKYMSLKKIEVSEFTILYQISTVTAVIVAIILLGENFHLSQVFGLFLVISAVIIVAWKNTKIKVNKGELYAILTAVIFGSAFINDAYILRSFDVFSYAAIAFLSPGIVTWLVFRKTVNPLTLLDRTIFSKISLSAVSYAIGTVAVYAAYQFGRNAAQISSISPTSTIVVVILAAIFLKERNRLPSKIVAAFLSVAGIVLLG